MNSIVKVLGFAGSLREKSFNKALLQEAVRLAPEGVEVETFDLKDIPLYNQDVQDNGYPSPVEDFRESITAADALLIVTPEYNYSIPGVLKNAIDWASRGPVYPLNDKPLAIMGASMGILGTARAQYHLRQVAVFTNMHALNRPEVFVGQAQTKFDDQGRLTDEIAVKLIGQQLKALRDWALRIKRD